MFCSESPSLFHLCFQGNQQKSLMRTGLKALSKTKHMLMMSSSKCPCRVRGRVTKVFMSWSLNLRATGIRFHHNVYCFPFHMTHRKYTTLLSSSILERFSEPITRGTIGSWELNWNVVLSNLINITITSNIPTYFFLNLK